jgi:hypothetical protein
MQIKNLSFGRTIAFVCLLLAMAAAVFAVSDEDASQLLVGSWYGERIHSGQIQGKPFNHRRWLTVHKSDGTARDIHRYYLDDQVQGEYIEDYTWGVKDSIYWNVCQATSLNGSTGACSDRSEYRIQSINAREFRYLSLKSGVDYTMVRVPEEFRLP